MRISLPTYFDLPAKHAAKFVSAILAFLEKMLFVPPLKDFTSSAYSIAFLYSKPAVVESMMISGAAQRDLQSNIPKKLYLQFSRCEHDGVFFPNNRRFARSASCNICFYWVRLTLFCAQTSVCTSRTFDHFVCARASPHQRFRW